MYLWWPRFLPFLGFTWVYSDRYGTRSCHETVWEVEVFIIAWNDYAIVLYQLGLPQRVDKR